MNENSDVMAIIGKQCYDEACRLGWPGNGTSNPAQWMTAKIERLRAIIDRLPKTADGVPITLSQTVFTLRSDGVIRNRRVVEITDAWIGVQVGALVGTRGSAMPGIIYSTREAAEKARQT